MDASNTGGMVAHWMGMRPYNKDMDVVVVHNLAQKRHGNSGVADT